MPVMNPNMQFNALFLLNKDMLLTAVVEALVNYTGGTIEDAIAMIDLAKKLKATPKGEITDEEFAIVEMAIATCSSEVKVSWFNMIKQLNS
jgi:hypothetical protein